MSNYSTAAFWTTLTYMGVVSSMLLRNIIFARLLDPSDYAVALTFGVVLSLFEYISNFGHENLMQRSKAGDQPSFQSTMQSTMIIRGALVALGIVLLAPLIPKLLNLGDIDFNFAYLAIVPLLNGFAHLDHQRLHRQQIYVVSSKISLSADISSVIVALICVSIWENYWAFYVSFVFRHSVSTFLSHVWAKRRYTLSFELEHLKSLMSFGVPLLGVGLIKYIGTEIDKGLVANLTNQDIFTVYILTLMLVVNGTNLVNVALSKIFLRRISTSGTLLKEVARSNGVIYGYLLIPLVFTLCIFGDDLISIIFGHNYAGLPFLILAICALAGLRSLSTWLNQIVIGSAPTTLLLKSDISRVLIAIIGIVLIYKHASVIRIALVFCFAELVYFGALTYLLNRRFPVVASSVYFFFLYSLFICVLCVTYNISHEQTFVVKIAIWFPCVLLFYGACLRFSGICRSQSLEMIQLLTKLVTRKASST